MTITRTRTVTGYDESGQQFTILERERWDWVFGVGWVRGWEGLLNTVRYVTVFPLEAPQLRSLTEANGERK